MSLFACMHARTHTHTLTNTHTHTYTHTHAHTHTCTHTLTNIHTHIHTVSTYKNLVVGVVESGFLSEETISESVVKLMTEFIHLGVIDPSDLVPYNKCDVGLCACVHIAARQNLIMPGASCLYARICALTYTGL